MMWQVSDTEKRRQLPQRLRGAAYDLICVKLNNPLITIPECLQALEQLLGVVDNPRDVQVK